MIPESDRTELALRVFDTVICQPNLEPIDALHTWCRSIAGLGAYVGNSAQSFDDRVPPLGEHLAEVGFAIERAAQISLLLADHVEGELYRLREAQS